MIKLRNILTLVVGSFIGFFVATMVSFSESFSFSTKISVSAVFNGFCIVIVGLYVAHVVNKSYASRRFIKSYVVSQIDRFEKILNYVDETLYGAKGRVLDNQEKELVMKNMKLLRRLRALMVYDLKQCISSKKTNEIKVVDNFYEVMEKYWREVTEGNFPHGKIEKEILSKHNSNLFALQSNLRKLVHIVNQ